jgi:thiol-disulfide isomerase/thioredoxin
MVRRFLDGRMEWRRVMAEEATSPRRKRTIRVIGLAAAAGVVAGLAAVYVIGGTGGNAVTGGCTAGAAIAAVTPLAKGEVAAFLPAKEPISLEDVSFTGPDGKPMTLADRAGELVLLNLWATWCAPCRAEMPALDRLQAALGGNGFEVVAVNLDTKDDGRDADFLEEIGVARLAHYTDRTMGLFNTLKSRARAVGLPTSVLVGPDGCEIGTMHGPAEWDSSDAKALIEAARGAGG